MLTNACLTLPLAFRCSIITTARRYSSLSPLPSSRARQHSQRGGQNLSERYIRLEKSLRGKEALEAEYENLHRSTLTGPSAGKNAVADNTDDTFRGLVIPEKPREPQSDECCMSGCAVCVYDLYEDSLAAYREAVAKVTATLNVMGVPESDWPWTLRSSSGVTGTERKKDVTLSVFEQMEREIQRRKQQENLVTDSVNSPSSMGSG
ncbi:oxidoreductase-like protein [Lentinula edodes]|uniref:Oxidoreductase-like protein n=1 Tax=Lentinula lateritia TaxID=40482 RepID=A0A9W9AC52_9AGAR|nr:oxidoreductase-like protein [Lentinula edodes]